MLTLFRGAIVFCNITQLWLDESVFHSLYQRQKHFALWSKHEKKQTIVSKKSKSQYLGSYGGVSVSLFF